MKKHLKLLRVLLIALIVVLFVYQVRPHIHELINAPRELFSAQVLFVLIGVFGLVMSYASDGMLSKLLLLISGFKVEFKKAVSIAIIDVFAAQALPMGEAGAMATSVYLYKKIGVDNKSIVFLSLAWGIVTNVALILIFLFMLPFMKLPHGLQVQSGTASGAEQLMTIIGLIIILSLILGFIFRKQLAARIPIRLKHVLSTQSIKSFISSYKKRVLNHKWYSIGSLFSGFTYYLGQSLCLYACIRACGIVPSFPIVVFSLALTLVITWITLIPGGLGISEASLSWFLLYYYDVPAKIFASILLFRIITFWIPLILGAVVYFTIFKKSKRELAIEK